MKLIWEGTDSLLLVKFPKQLRFIEWWFVLKVRLFAKFADGKVSEHLYCGPLVKKNLEKFGMKKKLVSYTPPIKVIDILPMVPHDTFNILYYDIHKTRMNRWVYGYDIYLKIKRHFNGFPDIKFIEADGSLDMDAVYPIVDLYIRPNRHDGHPRMKMEAEAYGIPTICTLENPDAEGFIDQIEKIYSLWTL